MFVRKSVAREICSVIRQVAAAGGEQQFICPSSSSSSSSSLLKVDKPQLITKKLIDNSQ